MKKFLMTLVAAAMVAVSANAQVYVGGSVGISSNSAGDDDNSVTNTSYTFVPEVGYNFNEDWAVGAAFGWTGTTKGGSKSVSVNPYVRWTCVHSKYINLFFDGGVDYTHYYDGSNNPSTDRLRLGIKPGIAVNINEHVSFVSHIGFAGWNHTSYKDSDYEVDSWGVSASGNNITFGLYYNF